MSSKKPPRPGFGHPKTRYSDSDGVWLGGSVTAVQPTLSVLLDDGSLVNGDEADDFPVMRLANEAASAGVDVHKVFLSQWEHRPKRFQFSYTKHPGGHFEWTGLKDGPYNGDDIFFCGVCTAMWHARPSGCSASTTHLLAKGIQLPMGASSAAAKQDQVAISTEY
eukprot:4811688-Prymnesium_polylepis.1